MGREETREDGPGVVEMWTVIEVRMVRKSNRDGGGGKSESGGLGQSNRWKK